MPQQNGRTNTKRTSRGTKFQQGRKKWKQESEAGKWNNVAEGEKKEEKLCLWSCLLG